MNISDIIKEAREGLGMTQEDLAEKLEVSRQAVSKWELGASVPSPENLRLLEEALGVTFPREEPGPKEEPVPQAAPKAAFWNWKRVVLLVLGVLALLSLLSMGIFTALRGTHTDVVRPKDPYITEIAFFDEDAAPLRPDLGDGWNSFTPGRKVLMAVEFQDGWNADLGAPAGVDAVSLFLTPAGTETYDLRQQLAVQAVPDGRHFALFALHISEGMTGHLDIVLESGGVQMVAETLKVTAAREITEAPEDGTITLSATDLSIRVGDPHYSMLSVLGAGLEDVAWISADPDIAGVSTTGMVWGVSPGVTTVTAEWNGQTAECIVRVAEAEEAE